MKKKKNNQMGWIFGSVLAVFVLLLFCLAVRNVENTAREKGVEQLEEALRQAAVACYAAEGVYPPDPAYLQAHYGVQIDQERYVVHYEIFADNLMPVITVLEQKS